MEEGTLIGFLRRFALAICIATLASGVWGHAHADTPVMPLALPTGQVVLSIQGKIQNPNQPPAANFDMEMLKRLTSTTLSTHTPWTNGLVHFKGVTVRELLRVVAVHGTHGEFSALNDYTVKIPLSDFDTYDAIVAYEMNDAPMSRREKGPLWLIYPMDAHDMLRTPRYRDRMVWQLRTITVQ
ncbi:molybdopterin-dependent oxidoreductase [Magnetovibrio sp. PR-2]|uniref:molybdopterin-dependent oxidoreductase n=1 Tax=Magnetovibrio sp. PR-2 TaxID=3120356 RepID=UPI002FCE2735